MNKNTLAIFSSIAFLMVACGGNLSGADDTHGAGGTGGASGGAGAGGGHVGVFGNGGTGGGSGGSGGGHIDIFGNGGALGTANVWNLSFTDVSREGALPSQAASLGKTVQLHFRQVSTDTYDVLFVPRFGRAWLLNGKVKNQQLVLSGSGRVDEGQPCMATSEQWQEITIPLGPDGRPSGTATLSGEASATTGDLIMSGKAFAKASISKDLEPPTFVSSQKSVLPWDDIVLTSSELLATKTFLSALAKTPNMTWSAESDAVADSWGLGLRLTGRFSQFPETATSVALSLAPDLPDANGNKSAAFNIEHKVLGLGPLQSAFDLDDDSTFLPVSYGKVAPTYWGQKQGSDPRCQSGGCMMLGPVEPDVSSSKSAVAGRLKANGKSSLAVRYRILAGNSPVGAPSVPPSLSVGSIFSITTASPGKAPVTTASPSSLSLGPAKLASDPLAWTTDWLLMTIPVDAGEVGFAIAAARNNSLHCMALPPEPPVAVIIDSIRIVSSNL